MSDIDNLKKQWLLATGTAMPPEIQELDTDVIRRALKRVHAGETVFIPKPAVQVHWVDSGSMMDFDRQDRMC